jgi:hypothetical protein
MISFNFDFSLLRVEFRNFWSRSWTTPFKNKFIELELHTSEALIGFNFLWTTQRDHAGLDVQLSLFGLCVHFNFYDNRHWDGATATWEK